MNRLKLVALLALVPFGFCLPAFADKYDVNSSRESMHVNGIDEIDYLGGCVNGKDIRPRNYEISVHGFAPDERIRVINKGPSGRNWTYTVAELQGNKTRLPSMTISGGLGGIWPGRGLWIERVKTGERKQLNRLPGNNTCNSKGQLSVKFTNLSISMDAQ